jgi:hypothetical protein
MTNRSERKRAYKNSVQPMGVLIVRNTRNGRFQLHVSRNLTAGINRLGFEITPSTNPNPELLADWKAMGPAAFEIAVLEQLEAKDEPGWDPTDDLDTLRAMLRARLVEEGATPY